MATTEQSIVPMESIAQAILVLRGQKVILDADLARLYGVETRVLNQAIKRNLDRFPPDFAFQLNRKEFANLKSQNVISSGYGGRRKLPLAFTEHGAVMAASVLNTPRAVEVSVYVVRAFVRLREILATHEDLWLKLRELEEHLEARLDAHDDQIGLLMEAIRALMAPLEESDRRIGFRE